MTESTQHWRCLVSYPGGVVHLSSEEKGMRTSCGVLLDYRNGPLMSDNHPDNVNCLRCQRTGDMKWAQLRWKDATYANGHWTLPEDANTTHHMVQWKADGGPMRCTYCHRTDVTSQDHCALAP